MLKRDCWHRKMCVLVADCHKGGTLLVAMLVMLLAACGSDDYTYSSIRCNLLINNAVHNNATLATAMNSASPGVFCKITYDLSTHRYVFTNNAGLTSSSLPLSEEEQRRLNEGSRVGMNNGLAVGYGNLSTEETGAYTFFAYDMQCPNCFDYNRIPLRSYPLTMSSAGTATCANCKREYNMNTGGNCINNSGKGLTRYRASTTGAFGALVIN